MIIYVIETKSRIKGQYNIPNNSTVRDFKNTIAQQNKVDINKVKFIFQKRFLLDDTLMNSIKSTDTNRMHIYLPNIETEEEEKIEITPEKLQENKNINSFITGMCNFGFSESQIKDALKLSNGNFKDAINLLNLQNGMGELNYFFNNYSEMLLPSMGSDTEAEKIVTILTLSYLFSQITPYPDRVEKILRREPVLIERGGKAQLVQPTDGLYQIVRLYVLQNPTKYPNIKI